MQEMSIYVWQQSKVLIRSASNTVTEDPGMEDDTTTLDSVLRPSLWRRGTCRAVAKNDIHIATKSIVIAPPAARFASSQRSPRGSAHAAIRPLLPASRRIADLPLGRLCFGPQGKGVRRDLRWLDRTVLHRRTCARAQDCCLRMLRVATCLAVSTADALILPCQYRDSARHRQPH